MAWYGSETGEGERGAQPWKELPSFTSCSTEAHTSGNCTTVGDALRTSRSALEPLLDKYGVDLYMAGHIHSYSVSWPIKNGAVAKQSLVDPQGGVHVLEGQGGVPDRKSDSASWINRLKNCSGANFRICGTGGAYGRLLTSNASVLVYEHVENPTGVVSDRWAITRTKSNGAGVVSVEI